MRSEEKRFDERQLLERGRGFKYGFITSILTTLAVFCITDLFEIYLPPRLILAVCIWLPLTVSTVYMITKQAYDGITDYRGMVLFTFLGIMAVILFAVTLISGDPLSDGGKLTNVGASFVTSACCVVIAVVYWVYHLREIREYDAEIEEERKRDKKD